MHPTSTPAASRSRPLLAVAAGVLAMLLYGGQFVVSRFSLQQTLTPWDLAALRFGVAGLICLPFLIRQGLRSAGGIGWRRSLVLAITAGAPYTLILYPAWPQHRRPTARSSSRGPPRCSPRRLPGYGSARRRRRWRSSASA